MAEKVVTTPTRCACAAAKRGTSPGSVRRGRTKEKGTAAAATINHFTGFVGLVASSSELPDDDDDPQNGWEMEEDLDQTCIAEATTPIHVVSSMDLDSDRSWTLILPKR